jgi:hypothetical protein
LNESFIKPEADEVFVMTGRNVRNASFYLATRGDINLAIDTIAGTFFDFGRGAVTTGFIGSSSPNS